MKISKENALLDRLFDEAHFDLNPDQDSCPDCGDEGYVHDCIDGFCQDAEVGCEDCTRRCVECARFEQSIRRHVELDVLRFMSLPLAKEFLRRCNQWSNKITERALLANLHAGRVGRKEFSDQERADSACWVECLL
ncbi:hypothetical protein [Rhodoplanes sp. Z2-YC6860]|uniref:hypothetical protein n=1 Tax=Rhodoplanes sp. Z2-YC6860 TaxID=674703 RepID=UPI00082D0D9F|nr:hypothetical protein [Rhodoplanes sp. Z2-YC6860]